MAQAKQYIQQNLIDIYQPPLEITSLIETDLTEEKIATLFNSGGGAKGEAPSTAVPVPVGLAGGFTPSGLLNTLAVCVASNLYLIQFRSKTKSSEDAVVASRKLLQELILFRPGTTLYAFDLAPLALSLYCDRDLFIENGVDVQSGCTCKDPRDAVNATGFAIASTHAAKMFKDNVRAAFKSNIRDVDNPKTSRALAMRAWLASYIPTLGDMEERFREVPKINTKAMPTGRLSVLGQFAKTGQLQDAKRPQQTPHDFSVVSAADKKLKFNSERFTTRHRSQNGRVELSVQDRYGGQFVLDARAREVAGRLSTLKAEGLLEGKSITDVTSVEEDGKTLAEQHRDATILAIMQGTSPLFDNPFLRMIWPDDDEVVWPEERFPANQAPPPLSYQYPLNESQQLAVTSMLSLDNESRITIIQGPPGTGKTTVIGAFVQSAIDSDWSGIWLLAQSNVAVRNIAEKLAKIGFDKWKLLVSKDFHFGWHEELYHNISSHTIRSDDLKRAAKSELGGVKVILSTLSMLSHPRLSLITSKVPLKYMVIDEASQIAVSEYIYPLRNFTTLQKLCFIGDDKQLPPYGQDEIEDLQSIFEISHLRGSAKFLDIQYRMPPHIGDMISAAVYDGQLRSNPEHLVPGPACFFVDINGEEKQYKTSWENQMECEAVIKIAAKLQEEEESFRIITPYEAQRTAIENSLKRANLTWQDKCFNVDSFQGNEDDYIIISVVRSRELGFLKDLRRTNVMLTRCKKGMFICTSWNFLVNGKGSTSLAGRMAAECGDEAWLSMDDVENGNF